MYHDLMWDFKLAVMDRLVSLMLYIFLCLKDREFETFLPATEHLEKKPGRRKNVMIIVAVLVPVVLLALLTGLLVWHFHRE